MNKYRITYRWLDAPGTVFRQQVPIEAASLFKALALAYAQVRINGDGRFELLSVEKLEGGK